MIATLTNLSSSVTLNRPNSETVGGTTSSGTAGLVSTGGGKLDPLPYPFNMNGSVAPSGTLVVAVMPTDFVHSRLYGHHGPIPREEINLMIQAGKITVTYAAQTVRRDTAEVFFNAI